jgi:hypothetical protein
VTVPEALRPFSRPDATVAELRAAAAALPRGAEPPSLWSGIANDASRPPAHRALAIEQLVRRQVTPGETTLGELGRMLDGATWLHDHDVVLVTAVTGKLPVPWSSDTTVVAIGLPGGAGDALYLALEERLTAGEVGAALRGAVRDPLVEGAVIRAAACAPGG